MSWRTNYTGKLCVASEPFNIYKDTESIASLIPHQVEPEEIMFVISCDYHSSPYDNIEAVLEVKFLYNGCVYQNQFKWGSIWTIPFQEVK